ncbi:MAG TPA: PP2C family serine/threonine-protein phosphatase [Pyrinomonadaceae bacterium]|jgi:serine/threonine protein phosphatase PrpC|nr:PP2C family serine/threonine-protein phosphatase [Pyrinomonadaceae bacterium]
MSQKFWRTAHASAIGQAHINQNTECQDRFACQTIETAADGEVLIAVVADGAGSTTDGQIGAGIACEIFTKEVTDFLSAKDASVKSLTADFGRLWISYFQKKIAEISLANKKELRDYASTFVGAVIGAHSAVFYQVGDGGIVFSTSGDAKSYRFAIAPVETEYVNVTEFVTDETAAESLRFELIKEAVEDLILFSDGIYAVAVDYQMGQPHEPFLMPMIAPLRNGNAPNGLNEKLENFLSSPKINEKTDDDKTIILASRATAEVESQVSSPKSQVV